MVHELIKSPKANAEHIISHTLIFKNSDTKYHSQKSAEYCSHLAVRILWATIAKKKKPVTVFIFTPILFSRIMHFYIQGKYVLKYDGEFRFPMKKKN